MERKIALIGNNMSHGGNPKSNERRKEQCRNRAEKAAEAAQAAAAETVLVAGKAVIPVPDTPAKPETRPDLAATTPRQKANN